MSYDIAIARGNPKHLAGRVEKLKPLDEAIVRHGLGAPPGDVEVHGGDGDELLWAGDEVIVQMLLVRSDDGALRAVEAGLTSGAGGEAEYAAVLHRLLDLAERVGGHLYEQPFDRRSRLSRARVEELGAPRETVAPAAPPEPSLLLDFYRLGDDAAEAYLERHAARAADAAADFRRRLSGLGASPELLETTRDGLIRLADWFFRSLPERYDGVGDLAARGVGGAASMPTVAEWRERLPHEPSELPPWCAPGAEHARSPLPPSALWLADGLGYHLAECVSREIGPLRWQVYRAPSRKLRDVDENHPVLASEHGTWNAHGVAYVLILRALVYRERGLDALPPYEHALATLGGRRDA